MKIVLPVLRVSESAMIIKLESPWPGVGEMAWSARTMPGFLALVAAICTARGVKGITLLALQSGSGGGAFTAISSESG